MKSALCFLLLFALLLWKESSCSFRMVYSKASEDPEIHMNTDYKNFVEDKKCLACKLRKTQLITSKGYPCEEYAVHTTDGYILEIQRIPRGRNQNKSERPVVLLQHGLLSCSACWVENLVNESLGFLLADAGFDVWLGNSRGNTYGRRHEKLDPSQKEFWKFSWDEMAKYDLPATVSKILAVSGSRQIFYIGHSQGGGIGFAQLSRDPEFASKIKLFVPLAPAVFLDGATGPLKLIAPFSKDLDLIVSLFGDGEVLPNDAIFHWLAKDVCTKALPAYLCKNFLFLLCGFDEKEINKTRVPVYIGQHPAGTSVQNLNHFAQMVNSGKFQMYDFGLKGNMNKYNQTTPPVYDPSNVTVPIALFSGTHDWLVVPNDVGRLINKSKTIVFNKAIDGWEHLDFIWAMGAPGQCYNDVIKLLKKYSIS